MARKRVLQFISRSFFNENHTAVVLLQCFYDLCLVRTPQVPAKIAFVGGHLGELGHCLFRVRAASPCQSPWLWGFYFGATQGYPGNHHHVRVCGFFRVVHAKAVELELPVCGHLPAGRSVVYLSGSSLSVFWCNIEPKG
uniref:Uncharacterized protein n=1 Tax=mine drainage metagenome TaxID=410659 RepID=E6QXA2_9ZZZZ